MSSMVNNGVETSHQQILGKKKELVISFLIIKMITVNGFLFQKNNNEALATQQPWLLSVAPVFAPMQRRHQDIIRWPELEEKSGLFLIWYFCGKKAVFHELFCSFDGLFTLLLLFLSGNDGSTRWTELKFQSTVFQWS